MVDPRVLLRLLLFHAQLLFQPIAAKLVDLGSPTPPSLLRSSAFLASLNTLPALRVALGTLARVEGGNPMPLLIADNASNDGSVAFLQAYASSRPGVHLILHDAIQWHGLWIDRALQETDADLLFVLDSDLIFFGQRLFERCRHYMAAHPECWILQADSWESRRDIWNNAADWRIHEEALSTWFLCIRTGLRDRVDESFVAVFPDRQPPRDGRPVMSDTGAKVVAAMRAQELEIHSLPRPWRWQFHHVGSLSWLRWAEDQHNNWIQLKRAKLKLLERWGRRLWPQLP
jgi:glycosyltransferase involved in cell wall biosynthesis